MNLNPLYMILIFVYGTIFGSFYNVVGDRLPNKKSIIKPRSHCPVCGHILTPLELIPVLSYVFQLGKCKNCKAKIPIFHPLYELFVGLLFLLCYLAFGFSWDLLIALTFISMLAIQLVSDLNYFIILDEIIVVFGILLLIEIFFINGLESFLYSLLSGVICFIIMYLIKLMGDAIFKKESMGGGDIKLMFVIGLVLGWKVGLLSIFLGSLIGLPISIIVLKLKKTNIIPFGPLLSMGAMILYLTKFDFDAFISILLHK